MYDTINYHTHERTYWIQYDMTHMYIHNTGSILWKYIRISIVWILLDFLLCVYVIICPMCLSMSIWYRTYVLQNTYRHEDWSPCDDIIVRITLRVCKVICIQTYACEDVLRISSDVCVCIYVLLIMELYYLLYIISYMYSY